MEMRKVSVDFDYAREMAYNARQSNTKEGIMLSSWILSCIDLAKEKHELEKSNRRLEKEREKLYGRLRFHGILEQYESI